MDIKKVFY